MTEPHTVITVFFLSRQYANQGNNNWEKYLLCSDNSEVWVGNNDAYFSSEFTRIVLPMFGSGFHHVDRPI